MKAYSAYKDSEIEWIGKIPEHWNFKRLKFLIEDRLKYGANESAEEENHEHPRYIRITDFGADGKLREETFKSMSPEIAQEYLLKEGDVLFARSGATVGKTFIFNNYNGTACFAGYLIKATPTKGILYPKFLYYVTLSNFYENWKSSIFIQATIQNIGADKYQNLQIPNPSFSEQTQIANYLDLKTNQIDDLIAKKERLIEILKEERTAIINQAVTKGLDHNVPMKDSGIEWLGEIPEHWKIKPLKYIANVMNSNVDKKTKEGESMVKLCNYSEVYNSEFITNDMDFMQASAPDVQIKKFSLNKHDLIITKDSESKDDIAVPALVSEDLDNTICGYHLTLIRAKKQWHGGFLFYLFMSTRFNEQFINAANGITRFGLGFSAISNAQISFPSFKDQELIFEHLTDETSKIDTTISKINNEIQLLLEYKTSLINEVVTGKVDVRNIIIDKEELV